MIKLMHWPPRKAITSTKPKFGFRHFVIINYGGKGQKRWVNIVSVLDGNICFKVPWDQIKDQTLWVSGWINLSRDEANPPNSTTVNEFDLFSISDTCLHPSMDSGLKIPTATTFLRPW